jgi:hypothetical protein
MRDVYRVNYAEPASRSIRTSLSWLEAKRNELSSPIRSAVHGPISTSARPRSVRTTAFSWRRAK